MSTTAHTFNELTCKNFIKINVPGIGPGTVSSEDWRGHEIGKRARTFNAGKRGLGVRESRHG